MLKTKGIDSNREGKESEAGDVRKDGGNKEGRCSASTNVNAECLYF